MYMSVEHSPSILVSVHTVKAIFSFDDHGILDKQAMVLIRKNIVTNGSTIPDISANLNVPIPVLFTMICVSESAIFTNLEILWSSFVIPFQIYNDTGIY